MGVLTRTRTSRQPAVSVDAVVAQIGGAAEELVKRYGAVSEDFMGRPMISFEDAKEAYNAFLAASDHRDLVRAKYEGYVDERTARRRAVADAARRAVEERLPRGLGSSYITQRCQEAVTEAWVRFDELEPELTITQFREALQ